LGNMKKITYVGLGVILLFLVGSAHATTFNGGEAYTLAASETVEDNLYAAGGNVGIVGTVNGDLLIAGGNLSITGSVAEDAMVAGGTVNITGNIGEDLRVAGGSVTISGNVGGEVVSATGQINFLSGGTIGGDLTANGGSIRIDAPVGGSVIANGGDVYINSEIEGSVTVRAGKVTLGPSAVIEGNFQYYSETEAQIEEGAIVEGEITFNMVERPGVKGKGVFAFTAGFALLKSLIVAISALVFVYLWKKWAHDFVLDTTGKFWKNAFYGFAALVLTPVGAVILLVTVVGAIPAVLVLLTYAIGLMLAAVLAGILTAGLANKYLLKKPATELTWWKIVLGVFAYQLVKLVPYVGWFVALVIFLASLGWLVNVIYGALAKARK